MASAEALRWEGRDVASERDWVRAHTALTRLARERAAADAEEGRWLLVAWRSGTHAFLGFGSFSEYIERLLGYSPRATREKLRVAEALETLPLSTRALEQGELTWCAVRELTRVAVNDTEAAWLEAAHGKTIRELERLVAGKHTGELPPLPTEPEPPRRHILRFEVAPETFATFREAARSLRIAAGAHLDDDALLLTMARHVLGAPLDERSSYRLSFQLCGACGQGSQVADGRLVPVDRDILEMAACDGEHLGVPVPANENSSTKAPQPAASGVEGATAPSASRAERAPAAFDVAPPSRTSDAASVPSVLDAASVPSVNDAAPISKTFSAAHTSKRSGAAPLPMVTHMGRARQAVPPALRRAVLARDRHRCQVPGCTHTHFVDVHHVCRRSEGGRNTLDNLITLCTAHHRATHRGELVIERSSTELVFRHADGTPYGQPLRADSAEAYTKIFSALRHLGFREREVQVVLAELRADAELRAAPIEHLLREALRRIRSRPT